VSSGVSFRLLLLRGAVGCIPCLYGSVSACHSVGHVDSPIPSVWGGVRT